MSFLKFVAILSIFVFLFIEFFHPISAITQDLGRHLLNGQIILTTHEVPKTNLFSYTNPNFPFINHHWLSEVIFYLILKSFGFNGLLILNTTLMFLSFGSIFFFILKRVNIIALSLISLLYLNIFFERTDVRPEIFSFLFLSIFILILYKYKEKFTKWIFLLIPLELLWVNVHIYFPIGIVILGIFLIDNIFTNLLDRKTIINNCTGILVFIFVSSTLVTLLNPNGREGALYPLHVFQNYGYSIEENQNLIFLWEIISKKTILYFFMAIIITFSLLLINIKKTKLIDWLIFIPFSILAILSIRNLPLFAIATFILFSENLSFIFDKIFRSFNSKKISLVVLVVLIFWQTIQVSHIKGVGFGVVKGGQDGVDFFVKNNLKGPIFNNFDIGSYLEYRLYPKEKVFVDGRPEAYPASFFQKTYIPMQTDENKFNEIDKKYNFQTIFFSHTDQTPWAEKFIKLITHDRKWQIVYLDDYAIILSKNKKLKFQIQNNYNNLQSLYNLAHFYNIADFKDNEIKIYQEILSIVPINCPVLKNLSFILSQKDDPALNIYTSRIQNFCK